MKKIVESFSSWLATKFDLPVDVAMDLPRITMVGNLHIYIENHRGLLLFSDKEIRLVLKKGQLLIKGEKFVIKNIVPSELLLQGKIHTVHYLEE